jgi:hypothetical protein
MKENSLRSLQQILTIVGAHTPHSTLRRCDQVLRFMRLGRWMADRKFKTPHRAHDRTAVFDAVVELVRNQRVLYLEFGVFQGASMQYWSRELKHPGSALHGFDSFEGLPEQWGDVPKGTFCTNGRIPDISDPRIRFFKGWFEQVLPTYSVPEHDVLVINIDADLYTSTIYVLRYLRRWIRAGTFLYFDDLSYPDHEPRAFDDFIKESGLKFRLISVDKPLAQAFFQCEL